MDGVSDGAVAAGGATDEAKRAAYALLVACRNMHQHNEITRAADAAVEALLAAASDLARERARAARLRAALAGVRDEARRGRDGVGAQVVFAAIAAAAERALRDPSPNVPATASEMPVESQEAPAGVSVGDAGETGRYSAKIGGSDDDGRP